jgi:hypothetical protein
MTSVPNSRGRRPRLPLPMMGIRLSKPPLISARLQGGTGVESIAYLSFSCIQRLPRILHCYAGSELPRTDAFGFPDVSCRSPVRRSLLCTRRERRGMTTSGQIVWPSFLTSTRYRVTCFFHIRSARRSKRQVLLSAARLLPRSVGNTVYWPIAAAGSSSFCEVALQANPGSALRKTCPPHLLVRCHCYTRGAAACHSPLAGDGPSSQRWAIHVSGSSGARKKRKLACFPNCLLYKGHLKRKPRSSWNTAALRGRTGEGK